MEDKAFAAAKSGATDAFSAYILGLEKTVLYRDDINSTPLHYASANGHLDLVQVFLLNGADVNAVNNFMETPLHSAAGKGQAEIVKRLLQVKDIQIDLQTDEGWTALHLATEKAHPEVVKLLLEHGADVSIQDKEGEAAVEYAHDPQMVDVITGSHSSDEQQSDGAIREEELRAADVANEETTVAELSSSEKVEGSAVDDSTAVASPHEERVVVTGTSTSTMNVNMISTTGSGSDKGAATDTTYATDHTENVDSTDQLETIDIEERPAAVPPGKEREGVAINQCCTVM